MPLMRHPRLVVSLVVLALAACDDISAKEESGKRSPVMKWRTLSDGSELNDDLSGPIKSLNRCWPIKGGFDCLRVFGSYGRYGVERYLTKELRDYFLGYAGGYSCTLMLGTESPMFEEEIRRRQSEAVWREGLRRPSEKATSSNDESLSAESQPEVLKTNLVKPGALYGGTGWNQPEVEAYIQQNDVPNDKIFFPCANLLELVANGSLASLGTTDLRSSTLPPPTIGQNWIQKGNYYTELQPPS